MRGTDELTISFDQVDVTNCPFVLTVLNITDSSNPKLIDESIATLIEPVLVTDTLDEAVITVSDYGSLIVQTDAE